MANFFTPNTEALDGFYEKGRFTLAWRLCVIFSFAFVLLSIVFANGSVEEFVTYLVCLGISGFSLFYMYRTKKYKFIYYFLAISGTIIQVITSNLLVTIVHIGDFLWMILIINMAFFGVGRKFGVFIVSLHLLNICYFTLFTINDNIANLLLLDLSGRIAIMIEILAATVSIAYVVNQFMQFHNYSFTAVSKSNEELNEQNTVIEKQHNEKSILIKEIHHRVKNNLQIIISLLRLQKKELQSEESEAQFNEAINRIMVMSLIHQKLYQDETLADIKLETYLSDLKDEILKLYSIDIPLEVRVTSEIERIGLKTIVPLGLIVNELMSNSIEHAFRDSTSASITIELKASGNDYFELNYSDNGSWKEGDTRGSGFGLELVEALTAQLEGTVDRKIGAGNSTFVFRLKDIDIEK